MTVEETMHFIDLGLIDYEEAWQRQRELVARRKLGEISDTVLFAEHPNVFTLGRIGRIENLLADRDDMERLGAKVLRVDRGGDITFHGPGQLVIYPIMGLRAAEHDLHSYLRMLEGIIVNFLRNYGIFAGAVGGRTGVWAGAEKIASIGIGASNWVTYHGIGLNINTDLDIFSMINPCGLKVKMTSMERLLGCKVSMAEAKGKMADEFDMRRAAVLA